MSITDDTIVDGKKGGRETLTFDDINLNGSAAPIPTPYHEFTWSNLFAMNPVELFGGNRHSGFVRGVTSGDQVAYFNQIAAIDIINSHGTFAFQSMRLTAGADSALVVNIYGFHNNSVVYSTSVTLDDKHPTLFTADWSGIDRIYFQTGAETPDPKSPTSGPYVVIDDLVVKAIDPDAADTPPSFGHPAAAAFGADQHHAVLSPAFHVPVDLGHLV